MYATYFPILDAILAELNGNGSNEQLTAQKLNTREAQRAVNTIYAMGKEYGLELEEMNGMVDAINTIGSEFERQGFINGFRMATLLQRECSDTVCAEAGYFGDGYPRYKEQDAGIYDCFFKYLKKE